MDRPVVDSYLSFLARWVDKARRHAIAVLVFASGLTALCLYLVTVSLSINTDTGDLLSEKLDYRQVYRNYEAAFPQFSDGLVIVVDGDNVDRARDAARRLSAKLREEVGENGTGLFKLVSYPTADPFFLRNGLLFLDLPDLDRLLARLADAQPLLANLARDPSLRGLAAVLADAVREIGKGETPPEGFADFLNALQTTVETQLAGRSGALPWQEVMEYPDNPVEARRQIIYAQPRLDFGSLRPAEKVLTYLHGVEQELGLTPHNGVRVRYTGSAALQNDELDSVWQGAQFAAGASFALVAGLLVVGLGSGRMVIATVVTLLIGLIWTAGFATVAVGHLNLISVTFAVLFIGLGVDFAIHFALRYREDIIQGALHNRALAAAAEGVGSGLTLSAIAAAVGFLSFVPTAYVGISELGVISSTGMAIAFFTSVTVLPALLTLWRPRFRHEARRKTIGQRWVRIVRRYPRLVLVAATILALAAVFEVPGTRFDVDPLNLRDPRTESMMTLADLIQAGDMQAYTISVLAPDRAAADRLAAKLETLPSVKSAVTLSDFVPGQQDEKLDLIQAAALYLQPALMPLAVAAPPDDAARRAALESLQTSAATLEETQGDTLLGEAAQELLEQIEHFMTLNNTPEARLELERRTVGALPERLAELEFSLTTTGVEEGDLPSDIVANYVAEDGRVRIEVIPREDIRNAEALRRFVTEVRAVAPNATDSPVLLLESQRVVERSLVEAFIIALVGITALLLVVLRSMRDTAFVLAPLFLAGLLTVAATVVLNQPFNFANVIVLPLLLGLGVASGIHLMLRYRNTKDKDFMETSTPRAVLFSALTTIGSFASLAASSHRGTGSMGLLLTLAILFTLVCTLVVLPALLQWVDGEQRKVEP